MICDATCATAAPGIYAAGDVARWHNTLCGQSMRIEHWTNAVEQSNAAAENLLAGEGGAKPFAPVPYVWSDQYDRKIQCCGWMGPDDEVRIVHGTTAERRFVALYGRKGRLTGAVAMNRVRQLMGVRRQLRAGMGFDAAVAQAEAG